MENQAIPQFDRDDFMRFFRDDEQLNTLSVADRIEVFSTILLGSSDFTLQLLESILSDYGVTHLKVTEVNSHETQFENKS